MQTAKFRSWVSRTKLHVGVCGKCACKTRAIFVRETPPCPTAISSRYGQTNVSACNTKLLARWIVRNYIMTFEELVEFDGIGDREAMNVGSVTLVDFRMDVW